MYISGMCRKIDAEALMMRTMTMAMASAAEASAVAAQHNVLWYVIFFFFASSASIHSCSFVKYANGNSIAVCRWNIDTTHTHTRSHIYSWQDRAQS